MKARSRREAVLSTILGPELIILGPGGEVLGPQGEGGKEGKGGGFFLPFSFIVPPVTFSLLFGSPLSKPQPTSDRPDASQGPPWIGSFERHARNFVLCLRAPRMIACRPIRSGDAASLACLVWIDLSTPPPVCALTSLISLLA